MARIVLLLLLAGLLSVPAFAEAAGGTEDGIEVMAEANGSVQPELPEEIQAETSITINETEVGAVPGDFFYGFKRFFENVDKFFTWDKSERAKKHARYGKLRAMEAHILSGRAQRLMAENKTADANWVLNEIEKLAKEQNDELERAQTELEAAVEDGSANKTEVEEVQNYTRNSIIVLQRVYEKAPEAAKDGLLRALNNSISNYERHVERMEERTRKREQKENQSATTAGGNEGRYGGNGNQIKEKNVGNESRIEKETEAGKQLGDTNQTRDRERNETHAGNGTGKGKGQDKNAGED